MRMLFALAEIPHHRFGFLFTHGNQSFRYVKRPIIGYFNLVIQSYAAKQRYLGLSRSMEGKDKIQTIGKIKKKKLSKTTKLSGSQSLFAFGFKRAKQDDDTGNKSVKKSDG